MCSPPTPIDHALTLKIAVPAIQPYLDAGYVVQYRIEQAYTVSHAIHA